jgi:hypothetical protein
MGNLLLRMQRGDDALNVGQLALVMAKTPEDTAMAEAFLESARKYQEYLASVKRIRERIEAEKKETDEIEQNTGADTVDNPAHSVASGDSSAPRLIHRQVVTSSSGASTTEETTSTIAHPDSGPHGPREVAEGKIVLVNCSSPALMDLTIRADDRSLLLHSENYYRVTYSALNFTPSQELQPCRQLEGMHAQIRYYHIKGQSYVGEMISIQLSK